MNTFYHGDCLFVMGQDIPPESVDLIYLDPPFYTGKVQKGQIRKVKPENAGPDWEPGYMQISYEDSRQFWGNKGLAPKAPVWMREIASKDKERACFARYLYYMLERLELCHKVLSQTGSIYLHCDWRASHYLKMIMDGIFGADTFQNEIIWNYGLGGSSPRRWQRKHDSVFFYTKTTDWQFCPCMIPATSQMMKGQDKKEDDVWYIPSLNNMAKERVGYPTQKPIKLLDRIILASSKENSIVLDPFCGCGTAILSAHKLNRQWIGIDINKQSWEVILTRAEQLPLRPLQQSFKESVYVSRSLDDAMALKPLAFQDWANSILKAFKPKRDKGVDGVTIANGTPIQTKTFRIGRPVLSQLVTDAKYHPDAKKPVEEVIVVSRIGFDDSAWARKDEIERDEAEGVQSVRLLTAEALLKDKDQCPPLISES